MRETAVIINEFGEISLDHLLVEYVGDNMVLLQSGCLCCTMRGDLVDALETLLRDLDNRRCTFRRVLLETTGLADPAPVLHTAMSHPYLLLRYRLDGVVTVVDAVNGEATLDAHAEAVKQAAVADRIVLTKTDLGRSDAMRTHRRALARAQSGGAHPRCRQRRGNADRLLGSGLYDPDQKIPDVKKWLAAEAYAERTQSSPSSRRQPARRAHRLLRADHRRADPRRHARDVPRTAARDARRQAAARRRAS